MPQAARLSDVDDVDFSKLDFGDATEESATPETPPETAKAAPEPMVQTPAPVEPEPAAEAVAEPVAEPEVPAEPESAPADTAESGTTRIPKHRFDFVQAKRREAEERAAALEAELAKLRETQQPEEKGPSYEDILAKYDLDIEQARLDGDAEKAAKLRGEQRRYEVAMLQQHSQFTSQTTVTQAQEQQLLGEVISQIEEAYPQFVEGSDAYDKDLVEEVLDLHSAYVAKGVRPSQAMAKATSYVLRANGLLEVDGEPQTAVPAKPEPKKTDIKKNVETASKQPPPITSNVGLDSTKAGVTKKADIMAMTIEEFEKLGERDLEAARGDFDF